MNWADVANGENSRDANCGPLSEITVSLTPHLANTCFIFRTTDCVVGVLVYAISIYLDSNRPSLCTCSPSPHIGHSRYFAMDTEATVCSSGAHSAKIDRRSWQCPQRFMKSFISIDKPGHDIDILSRSRHFVTPW